MGCISGIMKVMNDKSNSHRFPTELNVLMFERSFLRCWMWEEKTDKIIGRNNNNSFVRSITYSWNAVSAFPLKYSENCKLLSGRRAQLCSSEFSAARGEALKSVTAEGRNGFLSLSVWQRSSRLEKELLPVQLQVDRVGGVIQDGQPFVKGPALHHNFRIVQFHTDDRASCPDQFIESAGVIGSDASPPQQTAAKKRALATTNW